MAISFFTRTVADVKSALNELVNLVCDNIVEPEKQILGIAHADAYEDSLYIMDKIQQKIKVRDFINTSYVSVPEAMSDRIRLHFSLLGRTGNFHNI